MKKITLALCFGNRGFMPGELILEAREDMAKAVPDVGFNYFTAICPTRVSGRTDEEEVIV